MTHRLRLGLCQALLALLCPAWALAQGALQYVAQFNGDRDGTS